MTERAPLTPTPATRRLVLPARFDALIDLGPWIRNLIDDGPDGHGIEAGAVELAVHELVVNIMSYAYGASPQTGVDTDPSSAADAHLDVIELDGSWDGDRVVVRTVDAGLAYDPSGYRPPVEGEPQVGGYGILIIESIAESVSYDRIDGENRWTLRFAGSAPVTG